MVPILEGILTLEVRWIMPGRMDTAVEGWFGFAAELESREDAYLIDPHMDGLSVKVRGGTALEVKVFHGSPGILHAPGRVSGSLQYWQKWSFPFRPPHPGSGDPDAWRPVHKQRRTSRFTLSGARLAGRADELASEASCAVELTEIRMQSRDWWSIGLEATGPARLLRPAIEATAATVFAHALPDGVELSTDNSLSYAEWLSSQPEPAAGSAGRQCPPVIQDG